MTRMQQHYDTVVKAAMQESFGYENPMRIPKLDKIVLNMGMGDAISYLEAAVQLMKLDAARMP